MIRVEDLKSGNVGLFHRWSGGGKGHTIEIWVERKEDNSQQKGSELYTRMLSEPALIKKHVKRCKQMGLGKVIEGICDRKMSRMGRLVRNGKMHKIGKKDKTELWGHVRVAVELVKEGVVTEEKVWKEWGEPIRKGIESSDDEMGVRVLCKLIDGVGKLVEKKRKGMDWIEKCMNTLGNMVRKGVVERKGIREIGKVMEKRRNGWKNVQEENKTEFVVKYKTEMKGGNKKHEGEKEEKNRGKKQVRFEKDITVFEFHPLK